METKPILTDGVSYPNKIMYYLLFQIKNELDFLEREYCPSWCKFELNGKERKGYYDIYYGYKGSEYILEMDGGLGHGNKSIGGVSKEDSIFIDNEKDRLAKEHQITTIRIDVYYKNMYSRNEYIKNSILESLKNILPVEKFNFNQAFIDSERSLVIECAKLWNQNFTVGEITEKYNINKTCISQLLYRATDLGLCNYNGNSSIKRSSATSVICINNRKIFDSILEASIKCKIDRKSIKNCCENTCYSAGKDPETNERLFWMYYSDFILLSENDIEYFLKEKLFNSNNLSGRKSIVCLNTKVLYLSTIDAAKDCNTYDGNITKCCKGILKKTGHLNGSKEKLSWMYYEEYIKENDASTLILFDKSA